MNTLFSLLALLLAGTSTLTVIGNLRSIHRMGDAHARVQIDSVLSDHTYAIGPVADLQGEIVIMDGKVTITRLVDGQTVTHHDATTSAALLAFAEIEQWDPLVKLDASTSLEQLDSIISEARQGAEASFLRINTTVERMNWHVIHWPLGTPISGAEHKKHALVGFDQDVDVSIIGVHAPQGQGIITHHESSLHLHALTPRGEAVHIENMMLPPGTIVQVAD